LNSVFAETASMCRISTTQGELERKLSARETGFGQLSDRLGSTHGVKRTRDELCRPSAIQVVNRLRLEQLRVREDDAELIVQTMEEQSQVPIESRTSSGAARFRPAGM
jgi:hypothetical protein